MKLFVDSCVFVSFFSKEIHTEASKSFFHAILEIENTSVYIPQIVFLEVLNVLYREGNHNLNRVIKHLEQFPQVVFPQGMNSLFVKLASRKKFPKLKTFDLLIALLAKKHNAMLISWDRQLVHQAKNICQAMTPRSFVTKYASS